MEVEAGTDPAAAVLQDTLTLFSGQDRVKALLPNAQTESPATPQIEQAARTRGRARDAGHRDPAPGVTDYVT